MLTVGAFVLLLGCVFGSYVVSGGSSDVLIEAVPFEMWTIGGAGIGAFIMANSMHELKHSLGGCKETSPAPLSRRATIRSPQPAVVSRSARHHQRQHGTRATHRKAQEALHSKYPRVIANHFACSMICDYLGMVGMNADDPNQIEDVMARELKKTLNEEIARRTCLTSMADGLPALGIVAAVLAVIKTMSTSTGRRQSSVG